MRSQTLALVIAIAVLAIATIAELRPYVPAIHRWQYALAVALAGVFLVFQILQFFRVRPAAWRFATLAALGGIVIAAAFVGAELFIGPPQRVAAAPGQTYQPPRSSSLWLAFPAVSAGSLRPDTQPVAVTLSQAGASSSLAVDHTQRVHSYVFRCEAWPAAYVSAHSPRGSPETVTQPTGVAFVSPVLQFPSLDTDGLPLDEFAVPALHRAVAVKYYPGLPSRGIDIPFLQLQIKEENGGPLYTGVAVSGRALSKAGLSLRFWLGRYPIVLMTGAPDPVLYSVGAALVVVGTISFMFVLMRKAE